MSLLVILLVSVGGFIAGAVDAIAGGGGVINLPILMFTGLPIDLVLGTNKLAGTGGTVLATTKFVRQKRYSNFVFRYNLIFTAIGAGLGALCASYVSADILKSIVSISVIGIAFYFFFKPELGVHSTGPVNPTRFKIILSVVGAFILGFYDGIFGPGTGAFLMFMFIRLLEQDFVLAGGNTKILNLTSNVVALSIFLFNKKIVWSIGIPLALANMVGGYVGAHIAINRGASWVRWIFIVMALVVGIKQIL